MRRYRRILYREVISVLDYGAKGDGVTDDSASLQAAFNDGEGRKVIFPRGSYLHTQTLYPKPETHLCGEGMGLGGGAPVSSQLKSRVSDGPALYGTTNLLITDLILAGNGNGVGVDLESGSLWADRVHFLSFGVAVKVGAGFYYRFNMCEWAYCTRGLQMTQKAYNIDLHGCVMRFVTLPVDAGGWSMRKLAIIGGSYEEFAGAPSFVFGEESSVLIDGAYFETNQPAPVFGIDVRSRSTLTLVGNTVYLSNVDRWVNSSGQENVTLNAMGNTFYAGVGTSAGVAYRLPVSHVPNLVGDSWDLVAASSARYSE